jgi:TrmH family RNA methyltransferase
MHHDLFISSSSNEKFKLLFELQQAKKRKKHDLFLLEGMKEMEMAMESSVELFSIYYQLDIVDLNKITWLKQKNPNTYFYQIDKSLYSKVCYRDSTEGIIAIAKTKNLKLEDLKLSKNPLILIVESVEKPGNLGAILRTADAANIDAVICCELQTDLYNPNIIRSSLGTVFTVPVVVSDNQSTMAWLKSKGIITFCTNLHQAANYHELDFKESIAIVVGSEANGVSDDWIKFADKNIKIPMLGKIDSMNVSVASAILLFEAKRQRGF